MSERRPLVWREPDFNFWLAWFLLLEMIVGAWFSTVYLLSFLVIWLLYALPIVIREWPLRRPATTERGHE